LPIPLVAPVMTAFIFIDLVMGKGIEMIVPISMITDLNPIQNYKVPITFIYATFIISLTEYTVHPFNEANVLART
jgi:hypothetical protein